MDTHQGITYWLRSIGTFLLIFVGGCATVEIDRVAGSASVYQVSSREYDMHFISRGISSQTRFQEEVGHHAPGLCGDDNFKIGLFNSSLKSRMVYGGGVFVNVSDKVASYRITCQSDPDFLPRIVTSAKDNESNLARLRIVNTSGLLFDEHTGAIYISISGRSLGKLPKRQWIDIVVQPGIHEVTLMHKDIGTFSRTYEIDIPLGGTTIKAWATPVSTKYEAISSLPENATSYLALIPTVETQQ